MTVFDLSGVLFAYFIAEQQSRAHSTTDGRAGFPKLEAWG